LSQPQTFFKQRVPATRPEISADCLLNLQCDILLVITGHVVLVKSASANGSRTFPTCSSGDNRRLRRQ